MLRSIELPASGIKLYESKHLEANIVAEHYHDIFQLLYVLDGTGQIILDGRALPLAQDQLALILPHSAHTIMSGKQLTTLVLAFDREIVDSTVLSELLAHCTDASQVISLGKMASNEIRGYLRKMLFEQSEAGAMRHVAMKIRLMEVLLAAARALAAPQPADSNHLRAERIKSYIDHHYYEPLTARDIAAKLGVSTRHMNTVFKQVHQQTPMQYLTEVRVEIAKKLLAESGTAIATICFEAGYESLSVFYRAFKLAAGMSPSKYRTLQQQMIGHSRSMQPAP